MKRNPTREQVDNLLPGARVLVQLYGDRHETTCQIAERVQPDKFIAVGCYDPIRHLIMRGQVTALLD